MTEQHPIHPPPELVRQWCEQLFGCPDEPEIGAYELARLAAQWGAQQELEACCDWILNAEGHAGFDGEDGESLSNNLRSARRPTLLSLKQEALDQLDSFQGLLTVKGLRSDAIRRALELLSDNATH